MVCGGYSGEAAVSLQSAAMIMENIDRSRFEPTLIEIGTEKWVAKIESGDAPIDRNDFSFLKDGARVIPDICFIIVHGTPGEDGKLQGYLDILGIPYTSGGVMNTSITFNKIFTTRILRMMGIETAAGVLLQNRKEADEEAIIKELGLPLFVKPNEGGSSLGISKVKTKTDLAPAVDLAFSKGSTVLVEGFLEGREVTCGVISIDHRPKALEITEIKTKKDFFDYAAKYEYDQTEEITPADLPVPVYRKCQELSEKIYKLFSCKGVVRIDYKFFNDTFYVIEINTVPGMTSKSLVPQQAAAAGIDKKSLISLIIDNTVLLG